VAREPGMIKEGESDHTCQWEGGTKEKKKTSRRDTSEKKEGTKSGQDARRGGSSPGKLGFRGTGEKEEERVNSGGKGTGLEGIGLRPP